MDYVEFQIAVIDLAAKSVPLTVANVVAHLHVDPSRTETFLDRMTRDGRVDLEVDEVHGSVVYRVRGLSTTTGQLVPPMHLDAWRMPSSQRMTPSKSVAMAVLLGALLPGIGLVYAAPLRTVLFWIVAMLVVSNLLGSHLMLAPFFWMTASITSALVGGLYAVRFNQEGHRAALHS